MLDTNIISDLVRNPQGEADHQGRRRQYLHQHHRRQQTAVWMREEWVKAAAQGR
jgi:hypothetical protein